MGIMHKVQTVEFSLPSKFSHTLKTEFVSTNIYVNLILGIIMEYNTKHTKYISMILFR